jgi:hypothetical protein
VIVPAAVSQARPGRLKKSGQPFQVWRAPEDPIVQRPPAPRASIIVQARETVRSYLRDTLSFSLSHFGHSH